MSSVMSRADVNRTTNIMSGSSMASVTTSSMRRTAAMLCTMLTLILAAFPMGVVAQSQDRATGKADGPRLPERIWQDRGDIASLDLIYGAGGKAGAPDLAGTFTFLREDNGGSNPKFEVTDGQGVEWKVKLGPEARPETAATRFLWAAGYYADDDYYVAELTVIGLKTLRRGQTLVHPGGIVYGAKMARKRTTVTKVGEWDWFANPFLGQRDLNGLRVMMALLNNWDLKQVNNTIFEVDGVRQYVVTDVGATFGKTGRAATRSKGVPRDYEDSTFVAKLTPDFVNFTLHSRPFFLAAVVTSGYGERTRMEKITKHIPRDDALWLGHRLSLLTDGQIRDVFRAAGYGSADVEMLTRTVLRRIAALEEL
jgi:hypothetical protein